MSDFWDMDDIDNSFDEIGGLITTAFATLGTLFAVGTAIVCTISGEINKSKIVKTMKENGFQEAFVKMIDKCSNTITLEDLENHKEIKIQGDSISDDLYESEELFSDEETSVPMSDDLDELESGELEDLDLPDIDGDLSTPVVPGGFVRW